MFAIAPHLSGTAPVDGLLEGPENRAAGDDAAQRRAPRVRLPFSDVPADALRAMGSQALHDLVADSRPLFLHRLRELVGLMIALGGRAATASMGAAVAAVTRWWREPKTHSRARGGHG